MTRKTLLSWLFLAGTMLAMLRTGYAQGWERKYSPDAVMGINSVYQLPNGTYLTSGADYTGTKQRMMNLDAAGNVIGQSDFDSINMGVTNIAQNNGYVMVGFASYDTGTAKEFKLLKVNASGQKVWLANIDTGIYPVGKTVIGDMGVDTTNNGGFICVLNPYQVNFNYYRLRVRRIDANGNLLWAQNYFDLDSTGLRYGYDIRSLNDGGFVVSTRLSSSGPNIIFKIDSAGNQLWAYNEPYADSGIVATIARDGNILISGASYIGKLDLGGNVLWLHQYPALQNGMNWAGKLVEKNDSVFAIMAANPIGGANTGFNYSFVEADTAGNILSQRPIPVIALGNACQLFSQGYRNLIKTTDKGYLFGGWLTQDQQNNSAYLIKMDSTGKAYAGSVSGYAYLDSNTNCMLDNHELKLRQVLLSFSNNADTFNILTNDSGYYLLPLDTAAYQVSILPDLQYTVAGNCGTGTVKLQANTDSIISFAVQSAILFPYINMSAYNLSGSCTLPSVYTLQYCDNGTAPFTGTIDISLDSAFVFDSASLPLLSHTASVYSFADTLGVQDCRTLRLYYSIPCGLHIGGTAFCINAHAYSDTVANQSPGWDRSNLQLKVACNTATDSVTFMLKNEGSGNMQHNENLIVIEDNVILSIIPVSLAASQLQLISMPANGSAWRMTVDQTPDNPYSAFTTAFNEGCGTGVAHQLGYVNQFSNNGFYGFDYTLCSTVAQSYDPNHKSVLPEGAGTDHIIDTATVLEYTIEFQNTGTAAASNIQVVDTLASYLNPLTLKPGVSSFPYTVQFLASNVVSFTFSNINLPDTAVSQTASQGFVKFAINQIPGNTNGTVINNDAAIYFDYNTAIATNTATVTIGQLAVTGVQSLTGNTDLAIVAYPNPFSDQTCIKITGATFNTMQLNVYDIAGRIVSQQGVSNTNQFMLDRKNFSAGSYIFEVISNGQAVARGKIVAQ